MLNFNKSLNPVLDAIEQLHCKLESSQLNEEALAACESEVLEIGSFFSCTEEQAIVLGLLLRQHYRNNNPSMDSLISHLELPLSAAIQMNKVMAELVKKDWLKPCQDIRHFPLTNYAFNSRFLYCVTSMNWALMEEKPIQNSLEFLERFAKKLSDRKNRLITYERLVELTNELVNQHESIDLPAHILEMNLKAQDCTYFVYLCLQHYKGREEIDIDHVLNDLAPSMQEQFEFRNAIKSRKHPLFEHHLIEVSEMDLFSHSQNYHLSSTAIRCFNKKAETRTQHFESSLLTEMQPCSITCKKLSYNEKEAKTIERLESLLLPDQYESFLHRMKEKGMRPGLTVLLYGHPGTGKTETVMQLARKSGRNVLMAEASNIRNKWVGETEKNIRELFRDYRKAMKLYDKTPILLFNEADSIMSTRRAINDKVDQMENTLQNILLQELEENFEGIFIATTNLEDNLDKAFDRRLLYKVKFELPTPAIRRELWAQKLPGLPEEILEEIGAKYPVSGGQIDNICKKIQVEMLLEPCLEINSAYLRSMIEQEMILQNKGKSPRNPIGFLQHPN